MAEYDISDFLNPRASYRAVNMFYQLWEQSGFDYRTVPRPECGLLLVTQGSITYRWDGGSLVAATGDLLFLPKGCHYETITTSARDYLINFHTDAAPLPTTPVRLLSGVAGAYVDSFQRLVALKLQSKQRSFQADGQLLLLLERIVDHWKNGKTSFLDTALPLLAEGDLTICQVAERCGISESGFRAQFRKAMGQSPLQYRLDCKLAKAKYLLESTELPVQQIAEQLRFYDEAYFCKLFRQKTGLSPKAYAKNQKL